MAWTSVLAIYFIVWWLTLFAVLPFGVRTPEEAGETLEPGHAPSAPVRPRLVLKFLITTIISAIVFAIGYWVLASGLISLDNWPLMPDFRPVDQ